MTTKMENLVTLTGILEKRASLAPGSLEIRNAYGKVGLSASGSRPGLLGRDVSGLMSKPDLARWLNAAIEGATLRSENAPKIPVRAYERGMNQA